MLDTDDYLLTVDRVVPMGHTMDFDLIWDGYNLVNQLTRVVDV